MTLVSSDAERGLLSCLSIPQHRAVPRALHCRLRGGAQQGQAAGPCTGDTLLRPLSRVFPCQSQAGGGLPCGQGLLPPHDGSRDGRALAVAWLGGVENDGKLTSGRARTSSGATKPVLSPLSRGTPGAGGCVSRGLRVELSLCPQPRS